MEKKKNKTKKSRKKSLSSSYKKNLDNMKPLESKPKGKNKVKGKRSSKKLELERGKKLNHILKENKKRNLIKMKVLTTRQDFQALVKEIRKDFKIKESGFDTANKKNIEQWNKNLIIESDKMIDSQFFRKSLKNLNKVLKEEKIDYQQYKIEKEKINRKIPLNNWEKSIEEIVEKYHLSYGFEAYIRRYILFDEIDAPVTNYVIEFGPAVREKNNGKKYKWFSIKTFASLTKEEGELALNDLRELQKNYCWDEILFVPRPHTQIDKLLEIESAGKEVKKGSGRPKKIEERLLISGGYFDRLKKSGYSEKEIQKIAKQQKIQGVSFGKKIKEKTSKDTAKKILGKQKKSTNIRQAKHKLYKLRKRILPDQ